VPSAVIPIPVYVENPSTSFQISAVQSSPTAANIFAVKETSFSLSSVNINTSDGELGFVNRQSSSSKPRAKHSLLEGLNLTSLKELTPRERKVYERIQTKESALCKLKKIYKRKKMKELCNVDSDPLTANFNFFQCRGCPIFGSSV
jgi:hypothetical protein